MNTKDLLIGIAVGAGTLYFFDPRMGRRRRAFLGAKFLHFYKVFLRGVDVTAMEAHESAGNIPALQGESAPREPKFELAQENWSPAARILVGITGASMTAYGITKKGTVGTTVGLAGVGLLLRVLTNLETEELIGVGAGREAIELRKSIQINVSVEKVFNFWSNYENFPLFMSHVREVKKADGDAISHWLVEGPGGTTVEWNAVITEYVPNGVLAWKTMPDSAVQHSGVVHFDPNPDGSTRVDIRLSYHPIAGALGHSIAKLFAADPKTQMDEDLVRVKTYLETGKIPSGVVKKQ